MNLIAFAMFLKRCAHLERLLRIPVALEALLERLLQFLAEYVDAPSRQLVVQVRDDKVQGHMNFNMHDDGRGLLSICWMDGWEEDAGWMGVGAGVCVLQLIRLNWSS